MPDELNNGFEKAERLQNLLIKRAIGGADPDDDAVYRNLRRYFRVNQRTDALLPQFVKTARDLGHFWQIIQSKFSTYKERRDFIYEGFTPLLDHLEILVSAPADSAISEALQNFGEPGVHEGWERALSRRQQDPEGAITAARTLLESVCKHILDEKGVQYDTKNLDIHQLYKKASTQLNLSPDQHTEGLFKKILGGCSAVASGLGELRNRHGDAHGKERGRIRPAPRHAELAVNLAGSLALFLVKTHLRQQDPKA